jgi:hypothetical protein
MRSASFSVLLSLSVFVAIGCSSRDPARTRADDAGSAASDAPTGPPDAGARADAGHLDCDDPLDAEGCSCGGSFARQCYTGPAEHAGVGACEWGTQGCGELRVYGECTGSVLAVEEVCDNAIDDDCDGEVDDGCEGPTRPPPPPDGDCASYRAAAASVTADFPPSAAGACRSGVASSYSTPSTGTEELHVVGVYEGHYAGGVAHSGDDHPEGVVGIRVRPSASGRPVVLGLASYEPVEWRITLDPGASIARIFTTGFHAQRVTGVEGVPVRHQGFCAFAYGWEPERNEGGGEYDVLITQVRGETRLLESSFQGCYAGAEFTVPHP